MILILFLCEFVGLSLFLLNDTNLSRRINMLTRKSFCIFQNRYTSHFSNFSDYIHWAKSKWGSIFYFILFVIMFSCKQLCCVDSIKRANLHISYYVRASVECIISWCISTLVWLSTYTSAFSKLVLTRNIMRPDTEGLKHWV